MGDKKLKLLYLAKYLEEETDQEHPAGMPELLAYLTANGISAERKSVYDDLRLLESFGMDIETVKGRQFGYYLGERTFQLPEVKLLVDAVQAAPFLTQKKSMGLIGKLEQLTSRPMARQLRRQVYVLGPTPDHQRDPVLRRGRHPHRHQPGPAGVLPLLRLDGGGAAGLPPGGGCLRHGPGGPVRGPLLLPGGLRRPAAGLPPLPGGPDGGP